MVYIIIISGIFGFSFLLFLWVLKTPERKAEAFQRKILSKVGRFDKKGDFITTERHISDISFINIILSKIPFLNSLADLLDKANIKVNLFVFLLLSAFLFCFFIFLGTTLNLSALTIVPLGAIAATVPFLIIKIKLQNRRKMFEKNFVEALSIIKNALKSGQGLTSAIKLVSTDAPWPVDVEFKRMLGEMDYGFSFSDALTRLDKRIDLEELSFFIAAIRIQIQTGGNLASIIENIEEIVRTRFELKREINTLSAQGKMSGLILCSLPIVIVTVISIMHPGFFDPLINHPTGRKMLIGAVVLGFIGVYWIYKIVNIKL